MGHRYGNPWDFSKLHGVGMAYRLRVSELRRFGRTNRIGRHEPIDDELEDRQDDHPIERIDRC